MKALNFNVGDLLVLPPLVKTSQVGFIDEISNFQMSNGENFIYTVKWYSHSKQTYEIFSYTHRNLTSLLKEEKFIYYPIVI